MKLIESKVEIIEQQPGLDGVYKQIELAGRTCYKSEDKITEDSAKEFVDRMIKSKHGAMLEHGTVYLKITYPLSNTLSKEEFEKYYDEHRLEYLLGNALWDDKYTKTRHVDDDAHKTIYITTNLRVLCSDRYKFLPWHDFVVEPTEHHIKRITARFTCDMGVGREITRHRTLSFAQESTRYCNYSKSKFGEELTFVIPTWASISEGKYTDWDGDWCNVEELTVLKPIENDIVDQFLFLCKYAETSYNIMIDRGAKPQEARQVLPLGLKTEIVVTGFESDWGHFFSLHSPKCGAQGVHPDMAKLADELYEKLNSVNK